MSSYRLRSLEVTESNRELLWVAVVLAAAILPVMSALTAKKGSNSLAKRWIICGIANIVVFCLVLFGFMFQGVVDYAIADVIRFSVVRTPRFILVGGRRVESI